jgi:Fungal Zn(2)-Cys(6) binuclear cluster domain
MDSSSNEQQRHIPETRNRTLSCDFCKIRKTKCERSNTHDPCRRCIQMSLTCQSKIRKTPKYVRYGALEDLVRAVFPNANTADTKVLFQLAEAHRNPMPGMGHQTPSDLSNSTVMSSGPTSDPQFFSDGSSIRGLSSTSPDDDYHRTNVSKFFPCNLRSNVCPL